jgi:muconolactone delta-isomerase
MYISTIVVTMAIMSMDMMVHAFVVVSPTTTPLQQHKSLVTLHAYVPDGLTAEQWKQIKAKEAEKKANLGKVGPRYVLVLHQISACSFPKLPLFQNPLTQIPSSVL